MFFPRGNEFSLDLKNSTNQLRHCKLPHIDQADYISESWSKMTGLAQSTTYVAQQNEDL